MLKPVARAAVLAFSTSVSFGQEPPAVPAFPAQVDAITADVVVLGQDDRPVRGLTREDFTLLEDGKPQAIVAFEARDLTTAVAEPVRSPVEERVATNEGGTDGRTFAFLLDDMGSRPLLLEDAKRAIGRWLRERGDSRDEVTLATVSGNLWWSDRIDHGRPDLLAVLERVGVRRVREQTIGTPALSGGPESGGAELGAAAPPPEVGMRAMEASHDLRRRTQLLLGAMEHLSRGLGGARGRKSIVLFSEGLLYDTNERPLFDRSIDAAQRANTAIYFVDSKGLGGAHWARAELHNRSPQDAEIGVASMAVQLLETSGTEHLAENTGGRSIRTANDLLDGLSRITDESSTYYLLGYQPAQAPDGKWHKLEVKVAGRGMKVRTRRGYQATPPSPLQAWPFAAGTEGADGKKAPKRPLDPAVMTSGAADALALRVAPYVLEAVPGGLARVLVVLELDTSRLTLRGEGARRTGTVDLTLLGMSRDRGEVFPVDERVRIDVDTKAAGGWMSLSRELRLPPGVAQVRALVRDVASGIAGTVTQRLEVPPVDRPYLATPVVTDRVLEDRRGGAHLVRVAHRRFKTRGHLYCWYEVVGMTNAQGEATTRVAGGFTLRRSDGRIVSQAAPTLIAVALGGKVTRLFALPLAGLEPGEYELVLDVVDKASGRTLESREPFVLEPSAS